MEVGVISKRLEEQVGEREILAAVFTTYVFDPLFFELEVISLLLDNKHPSYVNDSLVKQYLVRDELRKSGMPIEVFYDAPMFAKEQLNSPQMDYLFHGVDLRGPAFHPKLIFLLVKNDKGEEKLLIAAGSNNLTYAGWWDNIECQHWVELGYHDTQRYDLDRFVACLNYLKSKGRQLDENKENRRAVNKILKYLDECKGNNKKGYLCFYGPYDNKIPKIDFLSYLKNPAELLHSGSTWKVEIISPFFADDVNNTLHDNFLKDPKVKEILLLLPRDAEDKALVKKQYYDNIKGSEKVRWADWTPEIKKHLGISGDIYRTLHAKIYRFYNGKQSWIFVGSVNFTHRAFRNNKTKVGNDEAGFLSKWPGSEPLLLPLKEGNDIHFSTKLDETIPGDEDIENAESRPHIQLEFNWMNEELSAYSDTHNNLSISLLGHEGEKEALIGHWNISNKKRKYTGKVDKLKRHLKTNSLLTIAGKIEGESNFPQHVILIQQSGWSHKPIDTDHLTADQILAVYSGMSPEQRQMLLMNAKIKQLIRLGQAGESQVIQDEEIPKGFFCEYAEIFYAFRQLKEQLLEANEDDKLDDVDYYLTGKGIDSLPTLINRAIDLDENEDSKLLSGVTSYLILLCAKELYRQKIFKQRPLVKFQLRYVNKEINKLKKSDRLKLKHKKSDDFFSWFEEQFFKEYKEVAKPESDQALS